MSTIKTPGIINTARRGKAAIDKYTQDQAVLADMDGNAARRIEEQAEQIKSALEIMEEKGDEKSANGRRFVFIDMNKVTLSREENSHMVTATNALGAIPRDHRPSFASRSSQQGYRSKIEEFSCEREEFIKLCQDYGVKTKRKALPSNSRISEKPTSGRSR